MTHPDDQMYPDQAITEPSIEDKEHNENILCMPIAGPCSMPGCSCSSFVVGGKHDAQFCENCGHSRSKHM